MLKKKPYAACKPCNKLSAQKKRLNKVPAKNTMKLIAAGIHFTFV